MNPLSCGEPKCGRGMCEHWWRWGDASNLISQLDTLLRGLSDARSRSSGRDGEPTARAARDIRPSLVTIPRRPHRIAGR
jgi:hypothetical protein